MSQNINCNRTLTFTKGGGGASKVIFDTDDSTTILYVLPATDATEYVCFGNATKNMDVIMYGGTAGNYFHWDESGDDLLLVGTSTQLAVAGTTESTSTTTGSLRTAGGLACVGDFYAGDDIFLTSGAVLNWNAGNVTLTHSALTLTLSANGILDLDASGCDVLLPSGCVDKADLAAEVYTIEHITLAGSTNDFDNQTVKVAQLWSAGTVIRVTYFTSAIIGTGLGIDILDGGAAGAGTDVIDSCSDNLSGLDTNTLTTPHALSAGDYICVKFDDVSAAVDFTIDIQVKVPVAAAT